jgi:arsenate reductase
MTGELPEVLFVCVHNAGRSQMAAAFLDHYAKGRVVVRSAGSTPADEINPAVLAVMGEVGLDLSKEFPKPLTTEAVEGADVVISMGCGDACPIFPGKRYLDWDLPDPAGKPLDEVRLIRDDIEQRVLGPYVRTRHPSGQGMMNMVRRRPRLPGYDCCDSECCDSDRC